MNLNEILDACLTLEQINDLKEKMQQEHAEKISEINNMKSRHEAELDEISKDIKKAIASKDFARVKGRNNHETVSRNAFCHVSKKTSRL